MVGISRSSYCCRKQPEKEENLELIKELDQLERGYLYLTVIIDWHSRRVFFWRLSNSLEASFFREALLEALEEYGEPEIFTVIRGSI